jgi:hypothetical protein
MASTTTVANFALAHLGQTNKIMDLDTETSNAANLANLFMDNVINQVLRDFDWPFARVYTVLGLVSEKPTQEWGYAYSYPSDCVAFRKIASGQVWESSEEKIRHQIYNSGNSKLIYTDQPNASGVYTKLISSPDYWDGDFFVAASFLLAHRMAPGMTGSDVFQKGKRALEEYYDALRTAKYNASLEEQYGDMPDSEFIRSRG